MMFKVLFLFLIITLFNSCSDKEDPLGRWDDTIKLAAKNFEIGAKSDSVSITTQGDWWWVSGISLNDSNYMYNHREGIDLEADSYCIKEDCLTVERRNKKTLFVKMEENLTGEERLITVVLEAGNYYDYVGIKQLAK